MKNLSSMLLLSLFLTSCGFEVVDTGNRGVKTTFGKVDEEAGSLPEGLHFYNPITSDIIEMNVQENKIEITATAYTKDMQQVLVVANANIRPDSMKMHTFYSKVGLNWEEKLVSPILQGKLKEIIGHFDAVSLVSERALATDKIRTLMSEVLGTKNIVLVGFEINNLDFNDEFEHAIEQKVVAVQQAEEAKNRTVQIEEKAKQSVIAAKAEAESMKIRSQALSENKSLVEYEAVQKWDGKLPEIMAGGNSLPFLNINKKEGK